MERSCQCWSAECDLPGAGEMSSRIRLKSGAQDVSGRGMADCRLYKKRKVVSCRVCRFLHLRWTVRLCDQLFMMLQSQRMPRAVCSDSSDVVGFRRKHDHGTASHGMCDATGVAGADVTERGAASATASVQMAFWSREGGGEGRNLET